MVVGNDVNRSVVLCIALEISLADPLKKNLFCQADLRVKEFFPLAGNKFSHQLCAAFLLGRVNLIWRVRSLSALALQNPPPFPLRSLP